MEFLRICVAEHFNDVVISIKASNTVVMVRTVRLLVEEMEKENMAFPLHLGVTEAGDGEDGRIKSSLGIGALLADGLGDTIRVSLSEAPENEIPVARKLVDYILTREGHPFIPGKKAPQFNYFANYKKDKETGNIDVLDYVAVVDCGTPINPNLARVQTEGGIAQGIGMALFEDVQYTDKGKIRNNSFMQYKIPSRMDIGKIRVDFESSYEESGPFGAKSIGELVIDTPCPALAEAIYNATGVRVRELPITPEKIAMGILEKEMEK